MTEFSRSTDSQQFIRVRFRECHFPNGVRYRGMDACVLADSAPQLVNVASIAGIREHPFKDTVSSLLVFKGMDAGRGRRTQVVAETMEEIEQQLVALGLLVPRQT